MEVRHGLGFKARIRGVHRMMKFFLSRSMVNPSRKRDKVYLPAVGASLLGALLWLSACATVPLTERKSLNLVSDSELLSLSIQQYDQVLRKSRLSTDPEKTQMVKRVGEDIARASEAPLGGRGA
jgi:hypothetical protein